MQEIDFAVDMIKDRVERQRKMSPFGEDESDDEVEWVGGSGSYSAR